MNRQELLNVNLEDLRTRLLRLGWTEDEEDRAVLTTPTDESAYIPFDEPDGSKVQALESIFRYLARVSGILQPDAIVALASGNQDIVLLGLEIPSRAPGRLPLSMSEEFYKRWEGFFAQAAAAETNFNSKGARRLPGDASRLVYAAEWGQTGQGSFLHALHIPLAQNFEPLGRRTWHRMLRCLATVEEASTKNSVEPFLSLEEKGWTAPMCEMLAEVVLHTKATGVKAQAVPDVVFDSVLPEVPTLVEATYEPDRMVKLLSNAALSLRGLLDPKEIVVSGKVFALTDPTLAGEDKPKTIRIQWHQDEGNDFRINVELNERDYAVAERAYFERRTVEVAGLMTSRGTRYWLSEPNNLTIV